MRFTQKCKEIFFDVIDQYHLTDNVDAVMPTPFEAGSLDMLLFHKCWIDTVQWHFEDIIRDPNIDPVEALSLKRRIDASNQDRTDKVEFLDSYFLDKYKDVKLQDDARINSETMAWAIDRLSILSLKIYHMRVESLREGSQKEACTQKLEVLLMQWEDLTRAIEELIEDIEAGRKYIKTYKQMKMYNDPALNPVLYATQK